ncbi:MAG: type II toxin-antitoxin system RelE/ParE family toxin [Gemmatimonadota bacterium]|nr:type II toxin-antitoxin system RelE/ParE family toxin [Gemmatimonadota bacterium]MDE2984540.1 type II toxin-antitoxin system RelE/ParE family toxin [Gemmatimonadota bacterium]
MRSSVQPSSGCLPGVSQVKRGRKVTSEVAANQGAGRWPWSGFAIPPTPSSIGTKSGVSYSIRIKRSAAKEIARIPRHDRIRIVRAIDGLAEQPLAGSVLKGELRGLRRIRVGRYRVVYEVLDDEIVVLVVRVAHRREACRRR